MKIDYTRVDRSKNSPIDKNSKEGERNIKQIASIAKPKKGLFSRMGGALFGEDGLRGIARHVGREIIIPAIKNIIVDGFITGVTRAVYGDNSPSHRSTGGYSASRGYTNYSNRYNSGPSQTRPGDKYRENVRASNRVEEYVISDRNGAMDVLTSLGEIADKYNSVTVADYYDMIGVPTEYTDNNYGWVLEDLSHVHVIAVRDGWVLNLPKARSLI